MSELEWWWWSNRFSGDSHFIRLVPLIDFQHCGDMGIKLDPVNNNNLALGDGASPSLLTYHYVENLIYCH